MLNLKNIFGVKNKTVLSKEEVGKMLGMNPELLNEFEKYYRENVLEKETPMSFLETNAKQACSEMEKFNNEELRELVERIVNELLKDTYAYSFDGNKGGYAKFHVPQAEPITLDEIMAVEEKLRPQLSGTLYRKDIDEDTYAVLLYNYKMFKESKNKKEKAQYYNLFRQGMDILDLDEITYEMIGMNENSMGNWLPALVDALQGKYFFKIPATTIAKIPIPLLQLTRTDYGMLTSTTMEIVNRFCQVVFNLNKNKEYFIKTGTYSSKFDFRNAHIQEGKEVMEIGEYLLYIHFQALQMASPLNQPSIYGVSTTNEWVVREFIKDVESNPSIYKGLPLHTEYRAFVDFDTKEILGITPYWEPETMKKRFSKSDDSSSPHQKHDYIIYLAHEKTLMGRYEKNKELVMKHLDDLVKNVELRGQWSVDIMQNGEDFYIIDMALACNSALSECVPSGLIKHHEECWIPRIQ